MSSEEKAKELYNKFLPLVQGGYLNETYHTKAKQCAIIAVDLHISELKEIQINFDVELTIEVHYFECLKKKLKNYDPKRIFLKRS